MTGTAEMSDREGTFIVIEGVEGSGKSTIAERLCRFLSSQGIDTICTYEPGATCLGANIRKALLESNLKLVGMAELFLYLADRAQHVQEIIEPALKRGGVVVCDRFSPSTVAYQGAGRGLGVETVQRACTLASGGLEPDLVLLLDLDPRVGLGRIREGADKIEQEPLDFHERVREAYLDLARQEPKLYAVIDASLPIDRVEELAFEAVLKRLPILPTGDRAAVETSADRSRREGNPASNSPPFGHAGSP